MIKVSICGRNSHHPSPCHVEHKDGLPNYLLLLVKTEAWFVLDNRRIYTKPNMAILFNRNSYIHYGCDKANYNDDWIHFDIDNEEELVLFSSLSIPFGQPIYISNIHALSHYVQLISNSYRTRSLHWEAITNSLMHALLYSLDEELATPNNPFISHKYYPSFSALRSQLYNDPSANWSGDDMAKSLCLSLSYFQHLYKDFFNCSCQQDIILARLEKARFYLSNSDMPIGKLALFCGYNNEIHFMRQFKKHEGITPSMYRANHKSSHHSNSSNQLSN